MLLHQLVDLLLGVLRRDPNPVVRVLLVQDPSDRSQLGPADVLDLRPLDLRVDDRVVNLDQGPRLTCTRPPVTRSETTSAISPAPVVVEDQIIEVVIGERRVDRALLDSPRSSRIAGSSRSARVLTLMRALPCRREENSSDPAR